MKELRTTLAFLALILFIAIATQPTSAVDLVLLENFSFVGTNHSCNEVDDTGIDPVAFTVNNTAGWVEKLGSFGDNLYCPTAALNFSFAQFHFDIELNNTNNVRYYPISKAGKHTANRTGNYYAVENNTGLFVLKEAFGDFSNTNQFGFSERVTIVIDMNFTGTTANASIRYHNGTSIGSLTAETVQVNTSWTYWAWTPTVDNDPHRLHNVYVYVPENELSPQTPEMGTVTFNPTTVYTNTDVNVTSEYTDRDRDNATVFINVTVGGTTVATKTMTGLTTGQDAWILVGSNNYTKGQNITVYFNATDADGNQSTTVQGSVIVANSIPVVNFTGSNASNVSYTTTWDFNLTVTDADGDTINLSREEFYNGASQQVVQNTSLSNGTVVQVSISLNLSQVGNNWTVTFNATDGADTTSNMQAYIFVVDDVAPVLASFNVKQADTPVVTGEEDQERSVNVDVTDVAGSISSVTLEIFRDGNLVETEAMTLNTGDTYSVLYSFPTPGAFTFNVTAVDDSGNTVEQEMGYTYTATDSTAPAAGGGGGGGSSQPAPPIIVIDPSSNATIFKVETGFGTGAYNLFFGRGEERQLRIIVTNLVDAPIVTTIECVNPKPAGFCDNVQYDVKQLDLGGKEAENVFMTITIPEDVDFGEKFEFETRVTAIEGAPNRLAASLRTEISVDRSSYIRLYFKKFVEFYDFFGFPFPKVIMWILLSLVIGSLLRAGISDKRMKTVVSVSGFFIIFIGASIFDNFIINFMQVIL